MIARYLFPKTIKSFLLVETRKNLHVVRKYSSKADRCDAHMNELPVPCAPWDPWYKDMQSYYNKVLGFGIAWFIFSLSMLIYTDSLYLNFYPPAQPGPPSDMVEECEDVVEN